MLPRSEGLQLKTVLLDQQVWTLKASMPFIQNTEITSKPRNETSENFLNFDSIGQNVEVLKEVFSHIIERVEGVWQWLDVKNLVDVNNNYDFKSRKNPKKSQKRKEQVETCLTRSKRKASGGSLVNPQKFYPCLICGEKKSTWRKTSHRLFSKINYQCHICDSNFKDLDTLFLHMWIPSFAYTNAQRKLLSWRYNYKTMKKSIPPLPRYYHDRISCLPKMINDKYIFCPYFNQL